jgi:hypothetical protein
MDFIQSILGGTEIIKALLGGLLLIAGRKLYWLLVAVIGFAGGAWLANQLFSEPSDLVLIIIGLIGGAIGVVLALFLQNIAIAIAGFLVGGFLVNQLFIVLGISLDSFSWLPFLIGGAIGVLLSFVLFNWALIILSSATGAYLISSIIMDSNSDLQSWAGIVFTILLVVGIIIQWRWMRRGK